MHKQCFTSFIVKPRCIADLSDSCQESPYVATVCCAHSSYAPRRFCCPFDLVLPFHPVRPRWREVWIVTQNSPFLPSTTRQGLYIVTQNSPFLPSIIRGLYSYTRLAAFLPSTTMWGLQRYTGLAVSSLDDARFGSLLWRRHSTPISRWSLIITSILSHTHSLRWLLLLWSTSLHVHSAVA